MTRISVLIPVFNGAEVVGQAIANILAQTFRPAEIVVADDGSRDGLAARLEGLRPCCERAGINLVYTGFAENRGRGAARNLALQIATSDLVAWYDIDDLWDPAKLAIQGATFARLRPEHPENKLILTCNYYRYAELEPKCIPVQPTLTIEDLLSVHRRRHVQLQTIFGPREVFLRVPFDEALNRAEDFDFALRYAAQGGKFVNPDVEGVPLVHYFRSAANAGDEAEIANRKVVEKSRRLFRFNHVDSQAFLAKKLGAMRRMKRLVEKKGDASAPHMSEGVAVTTGTVFSGFTPAFVILPDGSLALAPGAEGSYIAHTADLQIVARGRFRKEVEKDAEACAGLPHVGLVALFMAGARSLEVITRCGPTNHTGRLQILRAPSGLIRVAPVSLS